MPPSKVVSISSRDRDDICTKRNLLVEEHLRLVRPIAQNVSRSLPVCFELDDLISQGYIGLIEAAVSYRPGHRAGLSFSTYAKFKIKFAILESVRRRVYRDATQTTTLDGVAEPSTTSEVEIRIDQARLVQRLREAVAALPPDQREVIELHYVKGLQLVDLAPLIEKGPMMGKSVGRASHLKTAALKALRATLLDLDQAA